MRALVLLFVAVLPSAALVRPASPGRATAVVIPNDNRVAAGRRVGDTVRVALVAQMAEWYPDGAKGAHVAVEVFGEEGKAPTIPSPLLRVPAGTILEVTVRNALADTSIAVAGLWSHPNNGKDTLVVPAGETRTVRFAAGTPGTYLYGARIGHQSELRADGERETAIGAFIVDEPGRVPNDRVLVMNIWSDSTRNALGINGYSWPSTERFDATTGDTLRWRIINGTARGHPMHLHGFYFTVTSRGSGVADTLLRADQRSEVVTHSMPRYTTIAMEWVPTRLGNWLFHCHIGAHVTPEGAALDRPEEGGHAGHSVDATQHMRGLVVGIHVKPRRGERPAPRKDVRTMRLVIQETTPRSDGTKRFRYVFDESAAARPWRAGGPVLLLQRGQPTDVVIVNQLKENTAVHWHGIELESWSDGVAGWSGAGTQVAPAIAPADSFVAHLTLPRSGTFIYHTHLGDLSQMRGGLYGPIVVLAPGETFNPAFDHLLVAGGGGAPNDPQSGFVVNGDRGQSAPLTIEAGATHRLRLIGMGLNNTTAWEIMKDSTTTAMWTPVAKDGADLQPSLRIASPARVTTAVGETRDFLFSSTAPGEYLLRAFNGANGRWSQRIIVR